jgi:hypothetical protein
MQFSALDLCLVVLIILKWLKMVYNMVSRQMEKSFEEFRG